MLKQHPFSFRLEQTNGILPFPNSVCRKQTELGFSICKITEMWRHGHGDIKRKTDAQAIFLIPFTVGSSCKRKLTVCPVFDEDTNGSYPLSNGLTGRAHLRVKNSHLDPDPDLVSVSGSSRQIECESGSETPSSNDFSPPYLADKTPPL